ncbi:MAG: hypothetical protein ACSLE0_13775 [Chitinophagaceae bacterium]
MRAGNFWLKIFNVYPNEFQVVKKLYLFQFFQGAGIAFFFTSAFAQFLEKFPISELPWVMISSAILLWGAGLLYTRWEHTIKFEGFNFAIVLLMAISVLLLWIANLQFTQTWFLYFLLAWFNVLYLLNNLQFWGIAAVLFDLRQSKRLFAVISSGDIPAKFIGYTLATLVVPYTGSQNLLLIGAIFMLASLPLFRSILRSGHLEKHHKAHNENHGKPVGKAIRKMVDNIVSNIYVRRIAFISLLTSICILIINYGFYGEVRKAYHNDIELAKFIGLFAGGLRIIAFFTKMIFTSRLTASLGIKQTLLITPLGMVILIAIIVSLSSGFTPGEKLIFYLFGVSSMLVDVLRTSFNSPVLLTLMQPLSTHERLRAHNIVKGIMDPFASLLAGIFLLTLFYVHGRVDLIFLCYVLLILGSLWIGGVILVNRQYMTILIKTIGSRYFSREEFDLNNEAIIQELNKKMMKGTDLEVISILRMLSSKIDPTSEYLIASLIQHPSDPVKIEALKLISSREIENIKETLLTLLHSDVNMDVKFQGVKTFCKIADQEWDLAEWLDHTRPEIREAAITGMLGNKDGNIKKRAMDMVNSLVHSDESINRLSAVSILNGVKNEYDFSEHELLVNDPDPLIRDLAMKAIGRASHPATITALFNHLPAREKQVISSLYKAGENAILVLRDQISGDEIPEMLQGKLIALLGKIGGEKAIQVLLELLKKRPEHTSVIIKALYRCRYSATGKAQKMFETIAKRYIVYGVELLHMQMGLSKKDPHYSVLESSIHQEIIEIREILLSLFGCMYDRKKMNQVKYGLNATRRESIANAMEIIELTVKKDIGRQFNIMFETTGIDHRCAALRSLFTGKQFGQVDQILGRILTEKPILYYAWTKAFSIYISKKYDHPLDEGLFKKYIQSDVELLRETALFALPNPKS